MKIYSLLALIGAFAVIACSHSSDDVAPIKVHIPPANGGGTPPPAIGSDFGTTDGKAGGPCKPEILKDYQAAMDICNNLTSTRDIGKCTTAMNEFGDKHPNVQCSSKLADGTIVGISTNKGSDKPAAPAQPAPPQGKPCTPEFVQGYDDAYRACYGFSRSWSLGQVRNCESISGRFTRQYDDVVCVRPNNQSLISSSKIRDLHDAAYFEIFQRGG